jgi:hypothetical protein
MSGFEVEVGRWPLELRPECVDCDPELGACMALVTRCGRGEGRAAAPVLPRPAVVAGGPLAGSGGSALADEGSAVRW